MLARDNRCSTNRETCVCYRKCPRVAKAVGRPNHTARVKTRPPPWNVAQDMTDTPTPFMWDAAIRSRYGFAQHMQRVIRHLGKHASSSGGGHFARASGPHFTQKHIVLAGLALLFMVTGSCLEPPNDCNQSRDSPQNSESMM